MSVRPIGDAAEVMSHVRGVLALGKGGGRWGLAIAQHSIRRLGRAFGSDMVMVWDDDLAVDQNQALSR